MDIGDQASEYVQEFVHQREAAEGAGLTLPWRRLDSEALEVLGQSGILSVPPRTAADRTRGALGLPPATPPAAPPAIPEASLGGTEGDGNRAAAPPPPPAPPPPARASEGLARVRRAAWRHQATWGAFLGGGV